MLVGHLFKGRKKIFSSASVAVKMKKISILTANLGNFDIPVDCVPQVLPSGWEEVFYRFTDTNFPPITGLTPRLQYRIPKLFGWEMFPGYDYYFWLDGSFSLQRPDALVWFLDQLKDADILLFKHPWRKTIKEETDHITTKLAQNSRYIVPRYKNGLHKEQYAECMSDPGFKDDRLYASTVFMYVNTKRVQEAMKMWWYHQSRYYTVDQIALPYILFKSGLRVNMIDENQYKCPYLTMVSAHK